MSKTPKHLILLVFAVHCIAWAQTPGTKAQTTQAAKKSDNNGSMGRLLKAREVEVPSEVATLFIPPLKCDGDGNLYLHSDQFGVTGIRKLSLKGERRAIFQANADPDRLKVSDGITFSVGTNGELYQLVFLSDQIDRYIFEYKSDGTLKSKIKLEPGFPWMPATFAPFPSGGFLITGQEYDRDPTKAMSPVTAIFSTDGALLKEIKLEDDKSIRDMTEAGDSRVTTPQNPTSNRAIGFSQMEAGADGNIYLMRWLPSPVFYAISPGGEVVRRFAVDPGDPDYRVSSMHISGNWLAVLFVQPQTRKKLMKITDLEGHELATYSMDEAPAPGERLGAAFACYTHNPEQFVFLATGKENRLQILVAEPK